MISFSKPELLRNGKQFSRETLFIYLHFYKTKMFSMILCQHLQPPTDRHYSKALWSLSNLNKIHINMQHKKQNDAVVCLRPNCINSITLPFCTNKNDASSGAGYSWDTLLSILLEQGGDLPLLSLALTLHEQNTISFTSPPACGLVWLFRYKIVSAYNFLLSRILFY